MRLIFGIIALVVIILLNEDKNTVNDYPID